MRENNFFFRKKISNLVGTAVNQNKRLNQIKLPISL